MRRFRNIWKRISACASVGILLTSCGALWSVSDDSYMYPSGYDYNYGYGPAQPPIAGNGPGSVIPSGGNPVPPPATGSGPINNPTPPPDNQGFGKPQNPEGNGPQNPIPNLPSAGNNNSGGYRPSIPEGGGGGGNPTPAPNRGRH